jgi:DNA uptake protein ComE-like DNA-binding protein
MSTNPVEEQVRKQMAETQELVNKSLRAWSELMVTSTDMAYDTVLKSWNYSRSLRSGSEQAIEDAINTQSRLAREMMQAWQGYAESAQSIFTKSGK